MNELKLKNKRKYLEIASYVVGTIIAIICVALYFYLMIHFRGKPADELPNWWKVVWHPW